MSKGSNQQEGNIYDRIFKENAESIFMPLVIEYLDLDIASYRPLPKDFPKTLDREVDYLFEITPVSGDNWILHLEFQSKSDSHMVYRMGVYHSLILEKYKLRVKQVVVYLGKQKTKMQSELAREEIFGGYELIKINEIEPSNFLSSQVPEVVLLSLLSNYSEEQTEQILGLIYRRLRDYSERGGAVSKYLRQFILLSRLRNLKLGSYKMVDDMLIEYDIETDYFYKRGIKEGEERSELRAKKEKYSLARKMLDLGEPMEKIMLYTSLTKEEIESL